MNPSISDTLACILENLEELVFPRLAEEHSQSVARCTSILLRVVLLRLEREPEMLMADSREKRALFGAVAAECTADAPTALAAIRLELTDAAAESPLAGVGLERLNAENTRLKDVTERLVTAIHAEREALGPGRFAALQSRVRAQLRAQIDRELALVEGPYGGPGFPY